MNVNSRAQAWEEVNKIFPTDMEREKIMLLLSFYQCWYEQIPECLPLTRMVLKNEIDGLNMQFFKKE